MPATDPGHGVAPTRAASTTQHDPTTDSRPSFPEEEVSHRARDRTLCLAASIDVHDILIAHGNEPAVVWSEVSPSLARQLMPAVGGR
jgi:hypothetical protein